jgi:hypothetical protein
MNNGYRVWDKINKCYVEDSKESPWGIDPWGNLFDVDEGEVVPLSEKWRDVYIIEFATGRKDKSGKPIHIGDRLKYGEHTYIVEWYSSNLCVSGWCEQFALCPLSPRYFEDAEIVGTIHDEKEDGK